MASRATTEQETTIYHAKLSHERFMLRRSGKEAARRGIVDLFASATCFLNWFAKRLSSSRRFLLRCDLRGQIRGKQKYYRISRVLANVGWKRRLSCSTCKRPLKDLLPLFKVAFRKVSQPCTHKPVQGTWIYMDFSRHTLRDKPLCIGQVFHD